MADKAWKARERQIAEWFNTQRNPLSGANNRSDDGGDRIGDLVGLPAVVEVKLRKRHPAITRAKKTREEAAKVNKPWAHVEVASEAPGLAALVVSHEVMKKLAKHLLFLWERRLVK